MQNPKIRLAFFPIVFFSSFSLEGQITFEKTYGGTRNDFGHSMQQTQDGGYVLFGLTESYGQGGWDMYLIKTDSLGNTEWEKTYGDESYQIANSIQITSDNGFILCGAYGGLSNDSLTLIKTDSEGNELWNKRYRGSVFRNVGRFVQQTEDDGFIVTGYSGDSFVEDVFILKTDADGEKQWEKTFSGPGREYGICVKQLNDGGYVVLGETNSKGNGNSDMYLLRTNADGDTLWTKTYGTDQAETGRSLDLTADGGFILFGDEESITGDMYLVKTDSNGNELWSKYYGGDFRESGYSIEVTSDQGYIFSGSSSEGSLQPTDMYCVKTDGEGNMEWDARFREGFTNDAASVHQTTDGGFALLGSATYMIQNGSTTDMYFVKIDSAGKLVSSTGPVPDIETNVFPNPADEYAIIQFKDSFLSTITIELYTLEGMRVRSIKNQDTDFIRIDRQDLPGGIYFFRLLDNHNVKGRGKIIFQ